MSRHSLRSMSLEAIQHQKDTRFHSKLTETIGEFRKELKINPTAKTDGIARVVKMFTGLSVTIGLTNDYNAGIYSNMLNPNHPLLSNVRRPFIDIDPTKKIIKKDKVVDGTVDLEKNKVTGVFAELESKLELGVHVLLDEVQTDAMISSIVLHEIGHQMTYYEFLGDVITSSHVLRESMARYNNTTSDKERILISNTTMDDLGLNRYTPEEIKSFSSGEHMSEMVLLEYVVNRKNSVKGDMYNNRVTEAVADQYVSRLGAGRDLVLALDRFHRMMGEIQIRTVQQRTVINVISSISLLITIGMFPVAFAIIILTNYLNSTANVVDSPIERLTRIRQDVVSAMKQSSISKDARKRYQEDIEAMDAVLEGYNDRVLWISSLINNVFPSLRKHTKRKKIIQRYETLANNELFVAANKLKTID